MADSTSYPLTTMALLSTSLRLEMLCHSDMIGHSTTSLHTAIVGTHSALIMPYPVQLEGFLQSGIMK